MYFLLSGHSFVSRLSNIICPLSKFSQDHDTLKSQDFCLRHTSNRSSCRQASLSVFVSVLHGAPLPVHDRFCKDTEVILRNR